MATKKNIPKKRAKPKGKPKRNNKGQFLPGNREGTKFTEGNKEAEKWTPEATTELLIKMWDTLTEGHEDMNGNFIRANDIKTVAEVCLMHDIDPDTWTYIKKKHEENPDVFRIIKKILWVVEHRLVYSGQAMDMFVLKNHYGYKDVRQQEIGNKDDKPFKTYNKTKTIDYSKIPDNVLDALIAATSQDEE